MRKRVHVIKPTPLVINALLHWHNRLSLCGTVFLTEKTVQGRNLMFRTTRARKNISDATWEKRRPIHIVYSGSLSMKSHSSSIAVALNVSRHYLRCQSIVRMVIPQWFSDTHILLNTVGIQQAYLWYLSRHWYCDLEVLLANCIRPCE